MTEALFVHPGKLHYFVREIFKRLRVPPKDASKIADALVAADLAGVESQGVARLPFYADRLSSRLVNPTPSIKVVQETAAVATIDGDNGPGPVVGTKAMELALMKAGRNGVAAVAVRKSNQLGMLGYYARMALNEQMVGVAMTNDLPSVVPPFGTRSMYGTNPIAVAIPAKEGKSPFVLDSTTSATSRAKIEAAKQKGEAIPQGWSLDPTGQPATDPEAALEALRLLPLGSTTETGSHKGYGLGLGVEILCGVLSGGSFGAELSGAEGTKPDIAHIGHFFAALQIQAFGPFLRFRYRLDEMLKKLTSSSAPEGPRIFYPGEPEFEAEEERRANGIPVPATVASQLEGLARGLDLKDAWEHVLASRK
jgi:LDH2 family malate/lactate/ureidoglycolate dehydrogenase